MSELVQVVAEATPNPNSMKFSWGRLVVDGGPYDFPSEAAAKGSPLATKLFQENGVLGVFIAKEFVTLTKHPGVSWDRLQVQASECIREHVAAGEEIVSDQSTDDAPAASDPREIETRIEKFLEAEIRPAIAQDGGYVNLVGYNAGVVMIQFSGACGTCPSSTATLKMFVESRLREEIPEIVEVSAMV